MSKLKETRGSKASKKLDSKVQTKSNLAKSSTKKNNIQDKKKIPSSKQKDESATSKPRVLRKRDREENSLTLTKKSTLKNKQVKRDNNALSEEIKCNLCQKEFASSNSLSRHSSMCSFKFNSKSLNESKDSSDDEEIVVPIKKPRGRPPKNSYKEKSHPKSPSPESEPDPQPEPIHQPPVKLEEDTEKKSSSDTHSQDEDKNRERNGPNRTENNYKNKSKKNLKAKDDSVEKSTQSQKPKQKSESTKLTKSTGGRKRKRISPDDEDGDDEGDGDDDDAFLNKHAYEISDKPLTCTKCSMTYRTESGFKNHMSSCIKFVFSSSSELEDTDDDLDEGEDEGHSDIKQKQNHHSNPGQVKHRPGYEEDVVLPEDQKFDVPIDVQDIKIPLEKSNTNSNFFIPNDISPELKENPSPKPKTCKIDEFSSLPDLSSSVVVPRQGCKGVSEIIEGLPGRLPSLGLGHTNYSIVSIVSTNSSMSSINAATTSNDDSGQNSKGDANPSQASTKSSSTFVASVEKFFSDSNTKTLSKSKRKSSGKKKQTNSNSVQTETESQLQNQKNLYVPPRVPQPRPHRDFSFSEALDSPSLYRPNTHKYVINPSSMSSSKILSPRKDYKQEILHPDSLRNHNYYGSNHLSMDATTRLGSSSSNVSMLSPIKAPLSSSSSSSSCQIPASLPRQSPIQSHDKAREVTNMLSYSQIHHQHQLQQQHQHHHSSEPLVPPSSPTLGSSPASAIFNRYDALAHQFHSRDLSPLPTKLHQPHAIMPAATATSLSTSASNPYLNLSGHAPPETETITMQDSTGQIVRIQMPTVPSVVAQQAHRDSLNQNLEQHYQEQQLQQHQQQQLQQQLQQHQQQQQLQQQLQQHQHQQQLQQLQQQLSYPSLAMSLQPGQTHLMPYSNASSTSLAYQDSVAQQQYYNWPINYQSQVGSHNVSNLYVEQQFQLQLQLHQQQQHHHQQQQLQLQQQQHIALQLQQHPQQPLFQQYSHPSYSSSQSQPQSFQFAQQQFGLPGGSVQQPLQTPSAWLNGASGLHALHAPVPIQAAPPPASHQTLGYGATNAFQQPTVIQNSSFVVVQHGSGIGFSTYPVTAPISSPKKQIPAPVPIMPGPATATATTGIIPTPHYPLVPQQHRIEPSLTSKVQPEVQAACRGPSLATPCSCELCLEKNAANKCVNSQQSKTMLDYKFVGKGKIQQQFQPPIWSTVNAKRRKLAPAPAPVTQLSVPVNASSTNANSDLSNKGTEVNKLQTQKRSYKKKAKHSDLSASTSTDVSASKLLPMPNSSLAMSDSFDYNECQSLSLDPRGLNSNVNNIAVVRPLENPLQKICEQVTSIGSSIAPLSIPYKPKHNVQLLSSKSNINSLVLHDKVKPQKGKNKLESKPGHKKQKNSDSSGLAIPKGQKVKNPKSKSINITLKRKQGDTSFAIQQVVKSASSKNGDSGPMKSLKIKAKITNGNKAGSTTDVFVIPNVHVVPIPDSESGCRTIDEEERNNNIIQAEAVAVRDPSRDLTSAKIEVDQMTHRTVIVYEVKSGDKVLFRSSDVHTIWSHVFGIVQGTEMKANLPPLSYPSTDVSLSSLKCGSNKPDSGFSETIHQALQFLLKELPKPDVVGGKNKPKPSKRKNNKHAKDKDDFLELESASLECLTGCARIEGFKGRKPVDMFGWLASKHRSLPTMESCVDTGKAEMPLANPNAMRNRNLREKSPRMLGVFYSTIHGRGLFTRRDIQEGEMVIEYAGEIIRSILCDFREKWYESKGYGCYMFKIDEYEVVDSTMRGNAARFINHSCDPNCKSKVVDVAGQKRILIFSLRKILGGEELTYDYNFQKEGKDKKILCTCGTSRCRKFLN